MMPSVVERWQRVLRAQLPRRRRMTIAIGLLANDGIVIAADTQESTGDYMKGSKTKMVSFASMQAGQPELGSLAGACIISGAGDSGYVRALRHELGSVFLDNKDVQAVAGSGQPSLQEQFSDCLRTFYKKHVISFASFSTRDRPDVEMLIGIYRKHSLNLFVTEKTTLSLAAPYRAIGLGSTFAELFLDKLWMMSSASDLELLAAYIVFMTKESVESCGKYTQIATIHGSKVIQSKHGATLVAPVQPMSHVPWNKVDEWERSFRTEWAAQAERTAIWGLIKKQPAKVKQSASRKLRDHP